MKIIGENIHIISRVVNEAVKERNPKPIQDLALAQARAGADYIDVNVGPARKNPENVSWLVDVIQQVTDLPLSIDTMNPVAMENGLKLCKKRPLLNSVSGRSDSKQNMLPLAVKYKCDVVISVLTDTGCPPDVEGRTESIMNTVALANDMGIPNEDIWVDPIILPVSGDQVQVALCLEFVKILQDLLPGVKGTVGLSNVSNGTPEHLRPILNRTYMVMLEKCGMYSAIADPLDSELMAINRGERPNIVKVIHRIMDGEDVDLNSLTPEERDYAKTARVLKGDILYSHAWLEV
ncbi:MAG: dihydropteroate synthase [Dehalococcoidia bacterium]|nr:dihydropteroate synthase [Dehalococcoidia bacterium]